MLHKALNSFDEYNNNLDSSISDRHTLTIFYFCCYWLLTININEVPFLSIILLCKANISLQLQVFIRYLELNSLRYGLTEINTEYNSRFERPTLKSNLSCRRTSKLIPCYYIAHTNTHKKEMVLNWFGIQWI